MVGKDISTDARGKVNSEMTCKLERVLGSADGTPLTQLVSKRVSLGALSSLAGVAVLVPCTK